MAVARQYVEKTNYTEQEYFDFEETSADRWEYVRGEIRAMSGGTPNHSAIAANSISALSLALRGAGRDTCRIFGSDLKVHAPDNVNTYPDVSVVCGPPEMYGRRRDVITNPIFIAEVLSPSTEAYDRSGKWESYQTVPTLRYYLLLACDRPRAELYAREDDGWRYSVPDGVDAVIGLPLLGVALSMRDLYLQVEFEDV